MRIILNAGVKVTSVGSINDQVVPLYSALFSGIDHPGIVRAVFIDSDAFRTSDFLANLVVFSARLRNAGLSDHDLVYHVSEALAGALTGVGHSRIYEEADVYRCVLFLSPPSPSLSLPLSLSPSLSLPLPPLSLFPSLSPSHSLPLTLSLSLSPSHSLPLSLSPSHCISLRARASHRRIRSLTLALSLSPAASPCSTTSRRPRSLSRRPRST